MEYIIYVVLRIGECFISMEVLGGIGCDGQEEQKDKGQPEWSVEVRIFIVLVEDVTSEMIWDMCCANTTNLLEDSVVRQLAIGSTSFEQLGFNHLKKEKVRTKNIFFKRNNVNTFVYSEVPLNKY